MIEARYEIVVTRSAAADLAERLPESVAAAAIELITGSLPDAPRRLGAPLRNEYEGLMAARLDTYRVIYQIDEQRKEVQIVRVLHRRDAYRTPSD